MFPALLTRLPIGSPPRLRSRAAPFGFLRVGQLFLFDGRRHRLFRAANFPETRPEVNVAQGNPLAAHGPDLTTISLSDKMTG